MQSAEEVTKPKRKMVSISNDTLEQLAEEREGFESPDQCIKRLLKRNCSPDKRDQDEEPAEEAALDL